MALGFTANVSDEAAPSLPEAEPKAVGLCPVRLRRLDEALAREVEAGRIPGAVVAIARRGKRAHLTAIGYRDKATNAVLGTNAIFSIASMTKPMTSVAILQLLEEGRLLLADPVSKHLPRLSGLTVQVGDEASGWRTVPAEREPTVQDLLRHTSGLTYDSRGSTPAHKACPGSSVVTSLRLGKEETLDALAKAPLLHQPGTTWEYGFSTDVLGFIVEAVTGKPLGEVLAERIWKPLGMVDTAFALPSEEAPRYARALERDPLTGGPAIKVVHAAPHPVKWESGGGGARSTAADYLAFAQALLAGGTLGGARILGRKTVELMASDHLGDKITNRLTTMDPAFEGYGFGLGVAVRKEAGLSAAAGSKGDFYWSGVYGTYFWIDPREDMAVVFMAAAPGEMRLRYRQLVRALVTQAIVD
jgi:CubicO group peptidase (beta-lactamase class C family)